jgi:2-polyprenyl-6-methoxyphenol hydroxylase-like FAD-dependent oxidoreductase
MYDAIIVGARCAGSPLAMLLARKGYKVLLLDKATFPSDTISTHHIHQPGVARLKRWGLLEKIQHSNCPPTTQIKFDVGPFALLGTPPPADGNAEAYAPRRRVLDQILVDAAVQAGAELREKFSVEALTSDGTAITGIRGRDNKGSIVTEKGRIVIGADGARSFIARNVQAAVYFDKGMLTCNYYSYWSGVPLEGVELYPRPGRMIVVDKTNDGLTLVVVVWPKGQFERIRSNIETEFMREIREGVPALAARIDGGKREERFSGTGFLPNFLRKPNGAGWALVGDAGYHKDPLTAQGITNSFSHAEMLAAALDEGFSGRRQMDEALRDYERKRNEEVLPMFEHTCQLAKLEPPPAEMLHLLNALRVDQEETGRFLGTITGTVSIPEFYSPKNINRVIEASALKPAA